MCDSAAMLHFLVIIMSIERKANAFLKTYKMTVMPYIFMTLFCDINIVL